MNTNLKSITIGAVALAVIISLIFPSKTTNDTVELTSSEVETSTVKSTGVDAPVKNTTIKVKRLNVEPGQVLILNTEVNYTSVEILISEIQERSKLYDELYLILDSPGGSVFDGARLISYIESSTAKIHTVVYGMCASMCFQIFERGKVRYMVNRSVIMGHQASAGVRGNMKGMKNLLNFIDREVTKLDAYIANRAGMTYKEFDDLVSDDLWLAADDAIRLKLADELAVVEVPVTDSDALNMSEEFTKRNIKSDINTKNPLVEIY